MPKSVRIKVTLISGGFLILAAIITGLFTLRSSDGKSSAITASGDIQFPLLVMPDDVGRDLTINLNVPNTTTKDTIREFEKRLEQTEDKIQLTKNDLRLLSQALKDLDQRTSGIEKLPDGRTKLSSLILGEPSIVIAEHNTSLANFNSGDYASSSKYSQNAIKAYEGTQAIIKGMKTQTSIGGHLEPEMVSMLYRLGAMSVQRLGEKHVAYQYARKALEFSPSAINHAVLATTLYNLGKYQEALNNIEKAIQYATHNSEFIELKTTISAACSK